MAEYLEGMNVLDSMLSRTSTRSREQSDLARLRMCIVWGQEMSRDPKWKVGACLEHPDKRQVSLGYNGLVKGLPETAENWGKPRKLQLVRHAERNAINWAPFYKPGSTLFSPLKPCTYCLGDAVNNGISHVVWFEDPINDANDDYYGEAWDMIAAMVEYRSYPLDDTTKALLAIYGLNGTMSHKGNCE